MKYFVFTIFDNDDCMRVIGKIRFTKFQAAREVGNVKECGYKAHVLYLDDYELQELDGITILSETGREHLIMYLRALKLTTKLPRIEVEVYA